MSLPRYPEYKDSGIEWLGEVPSYWEIGRLKHLLRIRGGQDYKLVESEQPTEFPVIGSGGQFTYATDYLYDGESVLLGRKGTIDKPMHVKGKFWTVDTMFYTEVLSNTNGRYAYYAATTIPFSLYSTSTALPSMSQFDLSNHNLPLPSLPEQTQIARFLDHETAKIDALIREQERLIELLQEKRQAVISHTVTKGLDPDAPMKESGVEWLGEVPEHWKVVRMRWLARLNSGHGITTEDIINEGMFPVYGGNGIRGFTNVYTHQGLHALIGRQGALCGNVHYAKGKFWASEHAVVVTPTHELDVMWLGEVLRSMNLNQYSISAAQPGLAVDRVSGLFMPVPPYCEQQVISTYLNKETLKIDRLIEVARKTILILYERRSALISAAVTGKIDVRNWQPPADESAFPEEVIQAGMEVTP